MDEKEVIPRKELDQMVDQAFPIRKLLKWGKEITKAGRVPRPDLLEKVRRISTQEGFRDIAIPQIDVPVVQPSSGSVLEILHGSSFYPGDFVILEDIQVNRAMNSLRECLMDVVSRDLFLNALQSAQLLVSSILLSHDLTPEEVDEIAKYYCLESIIFHYAAGDWRESTFLLYGCMKVVANQIRNNIFSE